MSWSMRFLGFSMWVFGEAERCEVVPRHPYKPSWLYGLFVRWHEASEKRIYFSYPPLSFFLLLAFSSWYFLFVPPCFSSFLFQLYASLSLLLGEFGFFPCLRPSVFPRQEISTKARQRNERLSVFHHSANSLVIVIVTNISRECCIVIMLLVFVLRI